jgi:hypothetical protein
MVRAYGKLTKAERLAAKEAEEAAEAAVEAAQQKKEEWVGDGLIQGTVKRLFNPKPVAEKQITYAQMLEYLTSKRVVRLAVYDDGLEAIGASPSRAFFLPAAGSTRATDRASPCVARTAAARAHVARHLADRRPAVEQRGCFWWRQPSSSPGGEMTRAAADVGCSGGVRAWVRGRTPGDHGASDIQLQASW